MADPALTDPSHALQASTSIPAVGVDALGLVLGRGEEGSWDSHVVGNPVVSAHALLASRCALQSARVGVVAARARCLLP